MLVAFDFEGGIAESDPFVRLAEQHGTGDEMAAVLERLWNGDLDPETGIRSATDHLSGMPFSEAEDVFERLQIRPEASSLLSRLHAANHHVAIVTDAPELAVRYCLDPAELDVDTVIANDLPAENGAFTGDIEGPLVGRSKADALDELATGAGYAMADTVAVGDDRRDLPMLQAAGLGVGIDPVPVVDAQADLSVPSLNRLELTFEERGVL
ncbi:HAD family hydrolase [Haloplanus halobius]|uniref:HAD family hydrolase n=1 Tax=Haloplanus halobius TaxID=2934938 RepID=UPI00200D506B|nr:HAD family phosphatase [Haloplanus sp. XH21]